MMKKKKNHISALSYRITRLKFYSEECTLLLLMGELIEAFQIAWEMKFTGMSADQYTLISFLILIL